MVLRFRVRRAGRLAGAAAAAFIAVAVTVAGATVAAPFAAAERALDGKWANGSGFVLKIDAARAQASIDPLRPFAWQRFLVKSVDGDDITFSIGSDIFEAAVSDGELLLTGTTFRGEERLRRDFQQPLFGEDGLLRR